MNVPRREGKRKPFSFGRKKNADSANTIAAIGAMAKSGALRDAGPKPSTEERSQNHYDREDVKYEAQYGDAGRSASGERLPKKEAIHKAGKKLDKTIEAQKKDPNYNNGIRSATTWEKK
jgi:hypothetical protein